MQAVTHQQQPNSQHARRALRAVAQLRAAKQAGDERLADHFAAEAVRALDEHIAGLRAQRRRQLP